MADKNKFYQSKFDYYKKVIIIALITSCIAELFYLVSDFELFKQANDLYSFYKCIIPRSFCLIFLTLYIIISHYINKYSILIPLAYLTIHSVMWSTIFAIQYLPTTSYAREGFIIMHFMFLVIGLCSPKHYLVIFHPLVIVNILVSNYCLRPYPDLNLMLMLGIPVLVSVIITAFVLDRTFYDQYIAKNSLEKLMLTDNLTQLYNRHMIDKIISNNTIPYNMGILLLDIDLFKNINDDFGELIPA